MIIVAKELREQKEKNMNNYRAMTQGELRLLVKGSQWQHKNGAKYTVVGIANMHHANPDYPITILYVGRNGYLWAKTLDSFMEKMMPIQD